VPKDPPSQQWKKEWKEVAVATKTNPHHREVRLYQDPRTGVFRDSRGKWFVTSGAWRHEMEKLKYKIELMKERR